MHPSLFFPVCVSFSASGSRDILLYPKCISAAGLLLEHVIEKKVKQSRCNVNTASKNMAKRPPARLSSGTCPMYGKNTRVVFSNLCESPNYKYGTVYIGSWLAPKSHFPASHALHALSLTSQRERCSSFTKAFSYMAKFHK